MKIGILTLPPHTNYGGILQAYALQTILERMGHDAVVIEKEGRREKGLPLWKRPIAYAYRLFKKLFVDHTTVIRREIVMAKERPLMRKDIQTFIDRRLHIHKLQSLAEIKEGDFSAIVVGSDQIWRPRYFSGMVDSNLRNAFLEFTLGWKMRRIAYAASFGVDWWEFPEEDTSAISQLAKQFDLITVREKSGVELCKNCLDVEAHQVLDPTMLLQKEDYMKLMDESGAGKSTGNLFCYILDSTPEKRGLVDRISREKQLKPFYINAESLDRSLPLEERIYKPVEAWLRGFRDAEFVITDSFHACVFSIIFGKPFVAVGNKGRGLSRFQSLLGNFGLMSNLIIETSQYNPDFRYVVDDSVQARLTALRSQSCELLTKALN